jgi:hypothetical protein
VSTADGQNSYLETVLRDRAADGQGDPAQAIQM